MSRFRTGDRVFVRSPEEILATLDMNGALDGIPFMPEMLDWCGKPFRVHRRAEQTCVADHPIRCFPANDVVILDGPRCTGQAHDGCKRGCRIFWKEAWLCRADEAAAHASETMVHELCARLKVKADERRYFCQSTELLKATTALPATRKRWGLRIALREMWIGDMSVLRTLKLLALACWYKLRRARGADELLRGPCKRTPSESLRLTAGESVRVKSLAEIVPTLDDKRRNRGMGICLEMTRCCGVEAKVRYRVDRIIDESTGMMRDLSDTVVLRDMRDDKTLFEECLCFGEYGDCPRGELMYWREIWLQRAQGNEIKDAPSPIGADEQKRCSAEHR